MKNVRLMMGVALLALLALAGCCKDKPRVLDKGALLYVNVKSDMKVRAGEGDGLLTPREIVETAGMFMFTHFDGKKDSNISIADSQKDVENARIKMWGEQIIKTDGTLVDYWIKLRDVRIVAPNKKDADGNEIKEDNITGYIPNATMEKAEREIRKAYDAGDYDKVYKLFQDAYTATPITREQWLAKQEKGEL